jgi:hypothetical protein
MVHSTIESCAFINYFPTGNTKIMTVYVLVLVMNIYLIPSFNIVINYSFKNRSEFKKKTMNSLSDYSGHSSTFEYEE